MSRRTRMWCGYSVYLVEGKSLNSACLAPKYPHWGMWPARARDLSLRWSRHATCKLSFSVVRQLGCCRAGSPAAAIMPAGSRAARFQIIEIDVGPPSTSPRWTSLGMIDYSIAFGSWAGNQAARMQEAAPRSRLPPGSRAAASWQPSCRRTTPNFVHHVDARTCLRFLGTF